VTMSELLGTLESLGVFLSLARNKLHVDAPKGAITADLRAALVTHKLPLMAWLACTRQRGETPWAAELPIRLEDLPDFQSRWGVRVLRVTWPEGEHGLVAEVVSSVALDFDEMLPRLMTWAAEHGGVENALER
jgi:hypothetical protein